MTSVRFFTRRGLYYGFEARGHAGYAPEGTDIVCAAVSALTQTTVRSLEQLLGVVPMIEERANTATLRVLLPEVHGITVRRADDLIAHLRIGICVIAQQYPEHVRVVGMASPSRVPASAFSNRRSS